jgi:hypothetical protein
MNLAKTLPALGVNYYCREGEALYLKGCFIGGRYFGRGKVLAMTGGEEGM